MLIVRRALIAAALASRVAPPERAIARDAALPDIEQTVYVFDDVPAKALVAKLGCINLRGRNQISLADLAREGRYVVLWFFGEGNEADTELEALNFQRMKPEFDDLDADILGCSVQSLARIKQQLVDKQLLTIPFVSDPKEELISAFGAKPTFGGDTFRQTFIIAPDGSIRFIERNVQFGVGNFDLKSHATRVSRELYKVRNSDGWAV